MSSHVNKTRALFASAAVLIAAAVAGAGNAHADQYDYVSFLNNNGVAYPDIAGVLALGREDVCHPLRAGLGVESVLYAVYGYGYTSQETALIVLGAVEFMCPDQMPTLNAWSETRERSGAPSPGNPATGLA